MITLLFADNEEKIRELLSGMLSREGNLKLLITKQGNTIRILKNEELRDSVSIGDKVNELGETLCREKNGMVYKSAMYLIEKLLFEYVLERVYGNQFKAAQIMGINRNTMRSKVKRLGINVGKYK